ncbi:MAG: N-acetyltransferase family protein [Bdellovibrionales bacterium]
MYIRPLQPIDLHMLAHHRIRHSKENGRDGDFIFAPNEEDHHVCEEDFEKEAEALRTPVTAVGWMRIWIITNDSEVFGEITLTHRPRLAAALHRCLLMMGLERSVRGQGWGSKLMQESLAWARQQSSLDWITLHVFENNLPAKALYKKFGFERGGTTRDMFRVFGQSINDTEMVLRIPRTNGRQ